MVFDKTHTMQDQKTPRTLVKGLVVMISDDTIFLGLW